MHEKKRVSTNSISIPPSLNPNYNKKYAKIFLGLEQTWAKLEILGLQSWRSESLPQLQLATNELQYLGIRKGEPSQNFDSAPRVLLLMHKVPQFKAKGLFLP